MSKQLEGLNEAQWAALCRRVEGGMATQRDARLVEHVGLMPQAIRIRQGLATRTDAVLVHLQIQIKLNGELLEQAARQELQGVLAI
jgi:hypothetical protein